MASTNGEATYQLVKERYSAIARGPANETANTKVAEAFGYTVGELESVSSGNLGLGCGAPVAQAKLKEGETVLDLGSGGGLDVFLAAKTAGNVIGVDMSRDMIALARRNAEKLKRTNVEFVYSQLPKIALDADTVDCVISNCVINLIPHTEKSKVFQEMYRVLKPGGRVVVSDVLARKPLPDDVRTDAAFYVGCVAGASQIAEYEGWLRDAGFQDIAIVDSKHDLNTFRDNGCCVPSSEVSGEKNPACGEGIGGISDETTTKKQPCCDKEAASTCCENCKEECCKDEKIECCNDKDEVAELEIPEGPFSCCSPRKSEINNSKAAVQDTIIKDLNEWIGSFMVFSVKPRI